MTVSTEAMGVIVNTTDRLSDIVVSTLPPYLTHSPTRVPSEVVHAKQLRAVYLWVLMAVGLPANTACVVTTLSMPVSPYYVALLAVVDTLALVLKLLYHQLITYGALTASSCYFYYTTSFVSCYANWVLALICLERFVAVCFPFKKQELFSKRRIIISIVGLTVALCVVFIPAFFFYGDANESGKACDLRESMKMFKEHIWSAGLLTTLYFFLPFMLIVVFTGLIISRLQVLRRRWQSGRLSGRSGHSGPEHAISVMLVCASLVFVVLVLPTCLYQLFLKDLYDLKELEEAADSFLLYQVVTFLSDATHAVNFFVYFLSAGEFRAAFVRMLRCCRPVVTK